MKFSVYGLPYLFLSMNRIFGELIFVPQNPLVVLSHFADYQQRLFSRLSLQWKGNFGLGAVSCFVNDCLKVKTVEWLKHL